MVEDEPTAVTSVVHGVSSSPRAAFIASAGAGVLARDGLVEGKGPRAVAVSSSAMMQLGATWANALAEHFDDAVARSERTRPGVLAFWEKLTGAKDGALGDAAIDLWCIPSHDFVRALEDRCGADTPERRRAAAACVLLTLRHVDALASTDGTGANRQLLTTWASWGHVPEESWVDELTDHFDEVAEARPSVDVSWRLLSEAWSRTDPDHVDQPSDIVYHLHEQVDAGAHGKLDALRREAGVPSQAIRRLLQASVEAFAEARGAPLPKQEALLDLLNRWASFSSS